MKNILEEITNLLRPWKRNEYKESLPQLSLVVGWKEIKRKKFKKNKKCQVAIDELLVCPECKNSKYISWNANMYYCHVCLYEWKRL